MDELAAVLDHVFPDREPTARTLIHRGNHKQTTLVTFPDEAVVVQIADAGTLHTEATLATAIRERTTVPVPAIVAVGTLGALDYLVTPRVPGADLHERFAAVDPSTRRALAQTFGRALGELHEAFRFESYGPVSGLDGALAATGPTEWHEWFTTHVEAGVEALPPAFDDLRESIHRGVLADVPDAPSARLYPWDLRPGNALVADGELTAVLDWGSPLAAAPGLAVAKTQHLVCDWYVDDPRLRPAFRDGYEAVRRWPDVPASYRLAAVVLSAVDSRGDVTRPCYPERTGDDAVAFHREHIRALL